MGNTITHQVIRDSEVHPILINLRGENPEFLFEFSMNKKWYLVSLGTTVEANREHEEGIFTSSKFLLKCYRIKSCFEIQRGALDSMGLEYSSPSGVKNLFFKLPKKHSPHRWDILFENDLSFNMGSELVTIPRDTLRTSTFVDNSSLLSTNVEPILSIPPTVRSVWTELDVD